MDGADDLRAVDALQVDARDPEVRVPELALDHNKRDALVRHLDRVRMPQLVRSEPPPHARCGRGVVELLACGGRFLIDGRRSVRG